MYSLQELQQLLRIYVTHDLFQAIVIETTALCNRRCSFCPNSLLGREKGVMKIEDFKHIINQLSSLHYKGRISLHMYGEPLIDKRIIRFVGMVRRACPDAFIQLNTNGDFLTKKIVTAFGKAQVNLLYVSQYDGKINQNVKEILQWIEEKKPKYRHMISVRVTTAFTDNRGGLLPHLGKRPIQKTPCYRTSTTMTINWHGDVVLCCSDYFGAVTFGNIRKQSLRNIWLSPKFQQVRKNLFFGKRKTLPICSKCSYIPHTVYADSTIEEHFHRNGLFTQLFVDPTISWTYANTFISPN
ncbi:MAG: Radical SAM domain protein [Microgenomates group bacterium GW2011_GWB1_40_9]|nr:MAG: Radical SAM domain protein [Microgenomates group bacterium GW2011_GWC1_39_12]KKR79576.1 MAG: Radical SAM domain protein [Microgenomates group bacterium GW2011_GWB1_40_9]